MAELAAVATGFFSAKSGWEKRKEKIRESEAYRDASMRRMGAATREMEEEERNKDRMHSRAIALAAASGGGVDDPGMVALLGDLNAEGEYRVLSALWSGQDAAAGLQFRAEAARREGETAFQMGVINAFTSGYSTYNSFGGKSSTLPSSPGGKPATRKPGI